VRIPLGGVCFGLICDYFEDWRGWMWCWVEDGGIRCFMWWWSASPWWLGAAEPVGTIACSKQAK